MGERNSGGRRAIARRFSKLLIMFTFLAVVLAQCDQFSLYEEFEQESPETQTADLSIAPTAATLSANASLTFSATAGTPPYSFSIASGSGSIEADTGVYDAPAVADTVTVRVTDSDSPASTDDATVTVYEPLRIAPESVSLSAGSSFDFSATGGKTPYTFAVASGGGSINTATGVYSAPAGPDNVVVQVTDDLGNTRDAAVTVTAAQPLVISPSSTTLLVGDSVTFTVTGGTSPYTFSVLAPADGSIDSATGVYTAPGSPATDTIRVTDAFNNTSDATATVAGAGPLSISPDAATVPVNGQREFSASGGAPPYSFAVVVGAGSINASTGVYNAPASTDSVTVRVTDSLLTTDDAAVTVAGSGCGLGFVEGEPNDDTGPPWSDVDDFGIVLVPGCSTTITGVTDASGDSDVFTFEKGSANFVTFIATWNTGGNELGFQLYTVPGDKIAESDASDADSESLTWAVGGGAASHYLEIEVKGVGGVSYTLVISAD